MEFPFSLEKYPDTRYKGALTKQLAEQAHKTLYAFGNDGGICGRALSLTTGSTMLVNTMTLNDIRYVVVEVRGEKVFGFGVV